MAAMHRQLVVSLTDLRYISVECKNCGSSITLDMTRESDHQKQWGFAPAACSVCRQNYDTAIKNINHFRDAYVLLLCVADQVTLQGEAETADANASGVRASNAKD